MIGRVLPGTPEPLGASLTPSGVNFAVWAAAEAVEICIFDEADREIARRLLPARTGSVFHGEIVGLQVGSRYGLRAYGPYAPDQGLFFDPAKLLVDPFALQLDRPFQMDARLLPAAFGQDSAPAVPKAIVLDLESLAGPPPRPPARPWSETVIYELSVGGFTRGHPHIPEDLRGAFAGLAHPAALDHLTALGVTAVELMPVAAWIDERHLAAGGLRNAWGYNPVALLAPDPRLAPGGWPEVRRAVEALRARGIETLVDVVLNHTGEGDGLGPTLNLRGLDNRGYYRTRPDRPDIYDNDAGTGSTLDLNGEAGLRLAMDGLRAWRRLGGVDGFRFDLATVMGREAGGFNPQAALFAAIRQDPDLRGLKLIAEPWDCGPGGYQLGAFPAAWAEWNDRYRDTLRGFWGGAGVPLGELARRISGSQDLFPTKTPSRGVNFIVAHDGFTLADLTAYRDKHNHANGEDNRDGTDHNLSWNHGVEGDASDPEIVARRRADQRALLALLLTSRGTPMLAMGCETGRTQQGNNNAYAQDNATTWMNWASIDSDLMDFASRLSAIRAAHPALHEDRYLTGATTAGDHPDVLWLNGSGQPMQAWDWEDPQGATLQVVLTAALEHGLDRVVLVIHRGDQATRTHLPPPDEGCVWTVLADSHAPTRNESLAANDLAVSPRSVLILSQIPSHSPGRKTGASDAEISRLAVAAGIDLTWRDALGGQNRVSPESLRALLSARGLECRTRDEAKHSLDQLSEHGALRLLPRSTLAAEQAPFQISLPALPGRPPPRTGLTLIDERGSVIRLAPAHNARPYRRIAADGRTVAGLTVELPPLASGRYRLIRDDAPDCIGHVLVAPARAWMPPAITDGGKLWGLTAQLYAARGAVDRGLGDFGTLGELLARALEAGAQTVGVNPFHALFPADRGRASPYYPSDRRFLDPILIDIGATAAAAAPLIDYDAAWAIKRDALDAEWAARDFDAGALDAFIRDQGEPLARFALFEALTERFGGPGFRAWPAAFHDADSEACRRFAAENAPEIRKHQHRQWRAERDLARAAQNAAGMSIGLGRDLAVGAAPDGAEVWSQSGRIAHGVAIGAPPDAFSVRGQCWGLPPYDPDRLADEGFAAFGDLVGRNMRHAGALRIDHILGLARQFWIPDGAEAADGAYVAFPMDGLLAAICLESVRRQCLVVGEDLGTVPDGLRQAMHDRAILGMRVLAFERHGDTLTRPEHFPAACWTCASTHDLPPLAGWWEGVEIQERFDLRLMDGDAQLALMRERARDRHAVTQALEDVGLTPDTDPDAPAFGVGLAANLHAYLARTPSAVVVAQLEDLAGEDQPVNLPGTDRERPNWRRRIGQTLEELFKDAGARRILAALTRTSTHFTPR